MFNLVWSRAWLNPTNSYSYGLLNTKRLTSGPGSEDEPIVDNLEKEATGPLGL
jgi:hypothetical protein